MVPLCWWEENISIIYAITAILMAQCSSPIEATIDKSENCIEKYNGNFLGMNCQKLLDYFHFCSAGFVSFARGLNDTSKIVALLLLINGLSIHWGMRLWQSV